jgi:large subunit ribosomal protein L23
MHIFDVLRRPVITEKSSLLQEGGRYVFEVASKANKVQIRQAVEKAFSVNVTTVNVMTVRGKRKRYGSRLTARPSWKKAVVTLKQGDRIEIFEGA